ncbi:MAG: hypothetical protein RL077_6431, partial [Verrucomicrobiota bacterium]
VLPVALQTIFRKDRADIAVEFEFARYGCPPCGARERRAGECDEGF